MAVASFLMYLAFMFYMLCGVQINVLGQRQNITIGLTLNTSAVSKWVSPNGEFAFGFFNSTPTLYLVGVWFDKIPNKTVVWTANRDDSPVEEGSTLQLSNRGLELSHSGTPTVRRIVDVDQQSVDAAAMRDDGNFVMLDTSNGILWESFDHPTDTLLPGQVLQSESTIFSKAMDTNYSTGRFVLSVQDGNLKLSPFDRRIESYWPPESKIDGNPTNLTFDTNGLLSLVWTSSNGTSKNYTVWNSTGDAAAFSKRVTLDEDGVLRGYIWMGGKDNFWRPDWKAVDNPCQVKGQCGHNGICNLTINNKTECSCPPGFNFTDDDKHFKGCLRSPPPQNCSAKSVMKGIGNADWPGNDYASLVDINETACQQVCIEDCMCIVSVYGTPNGIGTCWKKQMPLMDGRTGTDRATFVKISDSTFVNISHPPEPRKEKGRWVLQAIGFSLLGCAFILATFSVIVCLRGLNRKLKDGREQQEFIGGLKSFTYVELERATGNFKDELGRGGSGKVYKGKLPDGRTVAVKKLKKSQEMSDKEFRTEMSIVAASHHKNLVQLYGFCDEGSHRLLVYEFMSNGSLDKALFEGTGYLDWKQRVQIVLGTARGILYLHQECRTQILHCDIKPQNILLDENYNAKISDFGIAKLIGAEQTRTFTAARGTMGYIAPEWQRKMAITPKVDVYSFGVMLLEIICCRKITDLNKPENEIILGEWVYDCLKVGRLEKLVEQQQSEIQDRIDMKEMERMVLVGLWCIQEDPFLRPSIKNVVQMLEGTVEMTVPPRPVEMAVPPSPGASLDRPLVSSLVISNVPLERPMLSGHRSSNVA